MSHDLIRQLIIQLPVFLLVLSFHELAHGYMAYRKGDYTAKMLGRLTMNPIKHLDPFGSVLFPLMLVLFRSGVVFGWAKPVPVSAFNFKNPRKDMLVVALAGPVSNFLLAAVLALVLRILIWIPGPAFILNSKVLHPLATMLAYGFMISIYLGVFNLIPVHPLDGSHVLEGLLPEKQAQAYSRLSQYGFIILMLLLFTGIFRIIVNPLSWMMILAISGMVGIDLQTLSVFLRI